MECFKLAYIFKFPAKMDDLFCCYALTCKQFTITSILNMPRKSATTANATANDCAEPERPGQVSSTPVFEGPWSTFTGVSPKAFRAPKLLSRSFHVARLLTGLTYALPIFIGSAAFTFNSFGNECYADRPDDEHFSIQRSVCRA